MSYRKWYIWLALLLLIFVCLLIQLLIASYKIQSTVQTIRHAEASPASGHHAHSKSKGAHGGETINLKRSLS